MRTTSMIGHTESFAVRGAALIGRGAAALLLISAAVPAQAYVGPGAGLTMLGALWAVIVAIVFLLGGLVLWPLRALRRRRQKDSGAADGAESSSPAAEDDSTTDGRAHSPTMTREESS